MFRKISILQRSTVKTMSYGKYLIEPDHLKRMQLNNHSTNNDRKTPILIKIQLKDKFNPYKEISNLGLP